MTIEQIKLLPSYDALQRNGLSDENIIQYYSLPKGQRGAFFNTFKAKPKAEPTQVVSKPQSQGTQKCTEMSRSELFNEVEKEFRRLMGTTFEFKGVKYNLLKLGYSFGWNNNKRRFGVHKMSYRRDWMGNMTYYNKRIELSRYALKYSEKELKDWVDTILHEIAHGIDAAIRGRSNHDWHWKMVARHIGCTAQRCGDFKIKNEAPSKYTIKCTNCGHERNGHKRSRVIERGHRSCGKCNPNRYDERYKLIQIQNY